jgi:hypothetical protein
MARHGRTWRWSVSLRPLLPFLILVSSGLGSSFLLAGDDGVAGTDIGDGPVITEHVNEADCESGRLSLDDLSASCVPESIESEMFHGLHSHNACAIQSAELATES